MASEYKKRGGGYNTDKSQQDESQKNLSKWSEEDWQTKEGSGNAKQEDGTEKRYLPKKAWENMTEEEKEETDSKKQQGSKKGKQHVANTGKAKDSRKKANKEEHEKYERKKADDSQGNSEAADEEGKNEEDGGDDAATTNEDSEDEYQDDDEAEGDEDGDESEPAEEKEDDEGPEQEDQDEDNDKNASAGQKRKGENQQPNGGASKKQKSNDDGNAPRGKVGSKHMDADEPAPRGSADRLPKKGAQVTWKAMPGYVDGSVEEVLTSGKTVDGKSVKASKGDPKIVLKSNKSGKVCVHKPDSCFYE